MTQAGPRESHGMFAGTPGKEMFQGIKLEELKAGAAGSHPGGKPLRVRGTNTIGSREEEGGY